MKTEVIRARCTQPQKEAIQKKAEILGLSTSQYILMMALKGNQK